MLRARVRSIDIGTRVEVHASFDEVAVTCSSCGGGIEGRYYVCEPPSTFHDATHALRNDSSIHNRMDGIGAFCNRITSRQHRRDSAMSHTRKVRCFAQLGMQRSVCSTCSMQVELAPGRRRAKFARTRKFDPRILNLKDMDLQLYSALMQDENCELYIIYFLCSCRQLCISHPPPSTTIRTPFVRRPLPVRRAAC